MGVESCYPCLYRIALAPQRAADRKWAPPLLIALAYRPQLLKSVPLGARAGALFSPFFSL